MQSLIAAVKLSVLLNFLLGLSRVLLAMSGRGAMPRGLSRREGEEPSPRGHRRGHHHGSDRVATVVDDL